MKNILAILVCIALPLNLFAGDVVGKVIVGYQGWFDAEGSGSPTDRWIHWENKEPSPGELHFEIYPDMREYTETYQTGFDTLGNGEPATLFSSYDESTIDVHVRWMNEYNIDGAALQRFIANTNPGTELRALRDSCHVRFRRSAEKHGVKFYIMYDISGKNAEYVERIKSDWATVISDTLDLLSSPEYAYENGKPVVSVWGMGFASRHGEPDECLELVQWLKEQGCYVIGGTPTRWRTGTRDSKEGFLDVYKAYDMIQPWMAGRMVDLQGVDVIRDEIVIPDFEFCEANGIEYAPCMFPGFGWSNWKDAERNHIPRIHGDFMWKQAYNIASVGIRSAYIGMFDEYDEGTNIMKSAENASMIPVDQYFLTMDADGIDCSSDFYLRLSDDITQMIKGEIPQTTEHPTPHTLDTTNRAPLFTSNEFKESNATVGTSFTESISEIVSDPEGGTITFSKVDGSEWITISSKGLVTGTPTVADTGVNKFTVRATDEKGLYTDVTMTITVVQEVALLNNNKSKSSRFTVRQQTGALSLSVPSTGNYAISLYSIDGRFVNSLYKGSLSEGNHSLQLNDISPGLYIIQLDGSISQSIKVLIK